MNPSSRQTPIGELRNSIQSWLFPCWRTKSERSTRLRRGGSGVACEKHRQFVAVCELCAPQDHMATFSRAFDAFARDGRPQQIHEAMLKTHYADKLAGHVSRDATAIHAREKAAAKPKTPKCKRGKRGRRRKDEPLSPPPETTRLQRQLERDLSDNLGDLPTACDWDCKKKSQGKVECWRRISCNSCDLLWWL